jgi:hypothetical protein
MADDSIIRKTEAGAILKIAAWLFTQLGLASIPIALQRFQAANGFLTNPHTMLPHMA